MARDPVLAPGGADQRGVMGREDALAPQVAAEGADGGELARRRRLRVPALVEIADEGAGAEVVEMDGRQLGDAPAEMHGEKGQILREIALVRAHRVRGGVLVQPEMFEKRFEVVSNHAARSLSARSEIAVLRSFLLLTRCSSGGITPKAMFAATPPFRPPSPTL